MTGLPYSLGNAALFCAAVASGALGPLLYLVTESLELTGLILFCERHWVFHSHLKHGPGVQIGTGAWAARQTLVLWICAFTRETRCRLILGPCSSLTVPALPASRFLGIFSDMARRSIWI